MTARSASGNQGIDKRPFAEALNVLTKSVLSVQPDEGGRTYTVLYTERPTTDPNAMLHRAVVRADDENVEVISTNRLCSISKFKAQVRMVMAGIREPIDRLGQDTTLN